MGTIKRVIGKKSVHIAKNINIWATEGNVTFNAAKKVAFHGEQNGVVYGKYQPPDLRVVECEYKLKSTYAHEQLSQLAKELDEVTFIYFMLGIFGEEIEISAYSKLYRGLSDQSIPPPEILVTRMPVRGWKACYSNKRKKILVWEHFIDQAIRDNDSRGELMAALVEEYGHHIDNLLRTELATNGKKDQDILDEGAKFAYQLFQFDIFNETHLSFARAQTPNYSGDLVVDFSELNREIQSYVGEDQWYDADPQEEDHEGFGAGFQTGTHGGIALAALNEEGLFNRDEVLKIYYGNWLRDYSQVLLDKTVRLPKKDLDLLKQNNDAVSNLMIKSNPCRLSHETWVELLELLAAKEFAFDATGKERAAYHYEDYLKKFRNEYGSLTKDILGIYRPEEHIDNPKGLEDSSYLSLSFNYEYPKGTFKVRKLYAGELAESLQIDDSPNKSGYRFMLKNYIHKSFADHPSADAYMMEQLQLAVQYGRTKEGLRHFGAALHVLEDFYAHTNFCELALMKAGFKNVYPWVEGMQGKDYTTIPVVTGKFLLDDTLASILPKIGEKIFPVGFNEYEPGKPGDRSFADAFILTMLEDLSTGQHTDGIETNPTYMGLRTSQWLKVYKGILALRDGSKKVIQKLGKLGRILGKSSQFISDCLTTFLNIGFNIFLSNADTLIKEGQTHASNAQYGTDPTHTQLAKDSPDHPLNPLATELAKTAIIKVAEKLIRLWKNPSTDPYGKRFSYDVCNTYTRHPKDSTQMDIIVKEWVNDNKNKSSVRRVESATVYEHVHKKILRKISPEKIQEIKDYFK